MEKTRDERLSARTMNSLPISGVVDAVDSVSVCRFTPRIKVDGVIKGRSVSTE